MSLKENMPVDSKGCGAVMRMSPYAFAGQFIQEIIHNTKKKDMRIIAVMRYLSEMTQK